MFVYSVCFSHFARSFGHFHIDHLPLRPAVHFLHSRHRCPDGTAHVFSVVHWAIPRPDICCHLFGQTNLVNVPYFHWHPIKPVWIITDFSVRRRSLPLVIRCGCVITHRPAYPGACQCNEVSFYHSGQWTHDNVFIAAHVFIVCAAPKPRWSTDSAV